LFEVEDQPLDVPFYMLWDIETILGIFSLIHRYSKDSDGRALFEVILYNGGTPGKRVCFLLLQFLPQGFQEDFVFL
jgi:hypothetical protein